ncbi:MAG: transporter substrate-binding protein [Bacilli bacterium]|nr:transporter substrate-binding protein [Bacilli bacterium]
MKRNRFLIGFTVLLVFLMAVGCTKGNSGTQPSTAPAHDPVTLTVYLQAAVSDDDFKLLFSDPVAKKYPYITLQAVRPATNSKLSDLVAAGNAPDLITAPDADLLGLSKQGILNDMSPLLKQYNVDLNRFDPAPLAAVTSDKGEVWGLPYGMEFNALYYNKDLFDKFGIKYPGDGMTWDDAIALAKKFTTDGNGVQYHGLDVISSNLMSFPFGLSSADGKTNKASINNDQWKQVFELTKQIQTIPGNEPATPENTTSKAVLSFLKDQNIAMMVSPDPIKYFTPDMSWNNWDIAQYPSYKDKPNVSGKVDSHVLTISKGSKHTDEAMKVLQVVTSDEVQLLSVRKTARVSPLKNTEMQKEFGADMPVLKGKNIQGIFKSKVVAPPVYSAYESDAHAIEKQAFQDYLAGKVDVNTALKQAEDGINKMLATKAAQN